MTAAAPEEQDSDVRPGGGLDAALQREIDAALGDMSLEDLMDAEAAAAAAEAGADQAERPRPAGIRTGTVIAVQGNDIFLDLGGKDQGVLPADQFLEEPLPAEGQTIEVMVEGYDEDDGLLLLSREGAVLAATWETIEEGQVVEGRVTGHNKGGLELVVNGIRAFMPISQIELFRVEELGPYVNQRLTCEVTEVDRVAENVVLSRRAILEREAAEARERAWETLAEGQIVTGVVRNVMPYGAFVDIGGVDGLLHVSDMSHQRVKDPGEIVKEGDHVEVKVLRIDRDERKVALGLKQTKPDPWLTVQGKYAADEIVSGRVTNLADFGAFVELEEGVEGLIPISEMSFTRRIKHPGDVLSEGEAVKVRVLSVDTERRRISLSLKRVGDDPWMGASVRWPEGSVADGVVSRLTDFGAFVELTPGVEGLVHISELSDGRVRSVAEVVREGETVHAKVLGVDEDARRISLSIKQLATVPEYTGPGGAAATEAPAPRRKRKRPLKGGLD